MPRLTEADHKAFAKHLQARRRVLIAEIREQMESHEDENSVTLRARFDDLDPHDDRAVGDWVREVAVAQAVRDTRELDDVEAALRRMEEGNYGECVDCGKDIPRARLDANLSAARCVPCQERLETRNGGIRTAL